MSSSELLPKPAPTNRRNIIFMLAAGTSFILYLHRYTWVMVRPQLEKEFDFTQTQLETIYTLFNVTYAVGQIPGGIICDFFGPHLFLGIIIAIWSLAMPAMGLTSSLAGIGGSRLVFGAAQAGCYPSLAKVTRLWFPLRTRTSRQGLIASFFGRSGGAVSTILFGFMLGAGLSWRSSLVIYSALGLAFAALFFRLAKNSPEEDPAVNEEELALIREGDNWSTDGPPVLPFSRALRNRSMCIFTVQQYMNAGADYVYSAIMGSYFVTARSVTDQVVLGILASVPLWGGAIGGIVGGLINDYLIVRTGNRRWSRSAVGFSGKLLACFCLYLSITNPNAMVGACLLFVTKFFSDWTQPTVWGTSTDMGGRYSATVFSIINTSGSVGGVVTPLIGGWLLDHYTTKEIIEGAAVKTVHYEPVFVMVGIMYLISALSWLFINCTDSLDRVDPVDSVGKTGSGEATASDPA